MWKDSEMCKAGWLQNHMLWNRKHGEEVTMEIEYQDDPDFVNRCKTKKKDLSKEYSANHERLGV